MAYQQPTAFFSKPTELSSEDFLNGVKTQDAAETFRRKRALADAFSASITTKPVIADSDIYDANGNRTQTKGDILARPGDVDQQKFFEHSAKAGLGFDEAAAVYNHYDMQKKAALSALKTGNEINALGGGTGVEGRAGAPVMRDQPAPQAQTATGLGTQDQATQAAPEPSIVESKAKAAMIARMLASKNKSDVKKAQTALGVKADGKVGNKSKGALAQLQAKLSEGDWKPGEADVFDASPERTNTSNINGRIVTTPEGRLSVDSAFDPQPSKFINPETMQAGRPDTRTSLQVIEDRAGANNFGQSSKGSFAVSAPKLSDFGSYKGNVQSVLAKNGLEVSDAGIQQHLQNAANSVSNFVYDPAKSVAENRAAENKVNADKQAAVNKAREGLAQGVDTVKGQAIATQSSNDSHRSRVQDQEALNALKSEGWNIKTVDQVPKINEIKASNVALDEAITGARKLAKAIRDHKITPDEAGIEWEVLGNKFSLAAGATTDSQREGVIGGKYMRKGTTLSQNVNEKGVAKGIAATLLSPLTRNDNDDVAKMMEQVADAEDRTSKARTDRKNMQLSGAAKAIGKGLKGKASESNERKAGESMSEWRKRTAGNR